MSNKNIVASDLVNIAVSDSGGNVTGVSTGSGTFSGNLTVGGNLTVSGNLNYQDVTNLVVGDPLIYIGANNTANVDDLGMIVSYDDGVYQHGGWVRDASDGTWKLFGNVTAEPTTTVDFTDAVYQSMLAGAISSTGNITGSYIFGNISQATGLGNIVSTNLNANGATFLAGNGSWQVPTQIVNGTTGLTLTTNSTLTATVAGSTALVLDTDDNVVIGRGAEYASGKTGTVVIGPNAGSTTGGYNGVAIGTQAGSGTQGDRSVAVGFAAGSSNQGDSATAIGPTSGMTNQGRVATALGVDAGKENQGDSGIAIGEAAGLSNQGANAIAIGTQTANNQGAGAISIGALATANLQAANSIALNATAVSITASNAGFYVAPVRNDTGNVTNAIYYNTTTKEVTYGPAGSGGSYGDANVSAYLAGGTDTANIITTGNVSGAFLLGNARAATGINTLVDTAGNSFYVSGASIAGTIRGNVVLTVDTNLTKFGLNAGNGQGQWSTAIGANAANSGQGTQAVAVGFNAARTGQNNYAVAVGAGAGQFTQGTGAVAVGESAGWGSQQFGAVAIGQNAGFNGAQGGFAIAIGSAAAYNTQGANAIAIGGNAASNGQGVNSIVIGSFAGNNAAANSIVIDATQTGLTSTAAGLYVAPVRNDTGNVTNAVYYNTSTKEVTYGPATAAYTDANVSTYLASGNNTAGYTTTGNISANNFIANGTLTVTGTVGTGNISGANVISGITLLASNSVVAGATVPVLPNSAATFGANVNSYAQVTFQNLSNGADATTDVVLTASNGNDTTNFIDVGVIGSGYDNATPTNSLGNIVFAADGYVYAQGNVGNTLQPGGNLAIGTTVASKTVKIFAGGNTASNIVATFANTGVSVAGNITGNYILGNGAFLTGIAGGGTPTAIVNGTSNVTIAASAGNVLFNVNGNTAGVIGTSSVYLGYQSGQTTPGQNAVAVGYTAGQSTQGFSSIAIGYATASLNQGQYAAAVGALAGGLNQGNLAVAVGYNSGSAGQGANSIAIGQRSGYTSLGANAIAIGSYAGYLNQGANSIAIGANAIAANASINSITLNATNANITVANQGLYVAPVRNDTGNITNSMYYNTTTKEITYGPIPGATLPQTVLSGNVTLAANQAGSFLYSTTSTAASVTIPSNANVAFAVGTTITIVLQGTGSLALTPQANVNLYLGGNATAGTRTVSPYGVATLLQVAADTWFINGTGVY